MSKRCNEKRITKASRTIKFLREQSGLSLKSASRKSGVGWSVIAHLETGRIVVGKKHLDLLLPVYGVPQKTFQMFAEGTLQSSVTFPSVSALASGLRFFPRFGSSAWRFWRPLPVDS